ncbi:MAG: DUF1643 domain-containing protein [Candidatus Marisimplicoccus sp.]|tara:strand:- start:341 stop:817 length:477 start_codon:yes stop_codon:yes gene_type:complete
MDSIIKNNILRKAKFSNDKKHRYKLSRHWDLNKSQILYIMLNPSIGNESIDDPTIKRLISFTRKFDYGGFFVGNLFTYITPNPKTLDTSIGLTNKNLNVLENLVSKVDNVVYAWGSSIEEPKEFRKFIFNPMCFGKNLNGTPKHPLYLPSSSKIIKFR